MSNLRSPNLRRILIFALLFQAKKVFPHLETTTTHQKPSPIIPNRPSVQTFKPTANKAVVSLASSKIENPPTRRTSPAPLEPTCETGISKVVLETLQQSLQQPVKPQITDNQLEQLEASPSENILSITSSESPVFCTCHKVVNGQRIPFNNGTPFIPSFPLQIPSIQALTEQYKEIAAQLGQETLEVEEGEPIDPDLQQKVDLLIDNQIKKLFDADCCSQCKASKTNLDQEKVRFEFLNPDTHEKHESVEIVGSKEPMNMSFLQGGSSSYEYVTEEESNVETVAAENEVKHVRQSSEQYTYEYVSDEVNTLPVITQNNDVEGDLKDQIHDVVQMIQPAVVLSEQENVIKDVSSEQYEYVTEELVSEETLQDVKEANRFIVPTRTIGSLNSQQRASLNLEKIEPIESGNVDQYTYAYVPEEVTSQEKDLVRKIDEESFQNGVRKDLEMDKLRSVQQSVQR